jgi:hypothetical protein
MFSSTYKQATKSYATYPLMDICRKGRESFRHASFLISGPIPKAGRHQAGRQAIQETQLFTNCRAAMGSILPHWGKKYGSRAGGGGVAFGL